MAELNPLLLAVEEELGRLWRQRSNTHALLKSIEDKIAAVEKTRDELIYIYNVPLPPTLVEEGIIAGAVGVTDAVRSVFRDNVGTYLSPTNVRDALKKAGLIKEGYDNEMAVIHQVIRRLVDGKELEPHPVDKVYRWFLKPKTLPPGEKLKDALNNAGKNR